MEQRAHPHGRRSLTHRRRRRAFWLLVAVVLLVAVGHFLWVSLFGPPARWGNDVRVYGEVMDARAAPSSLLASATALAPDTLLLPATDADPEGAAYLTDVAPQLGRALALTHRGARWIDDRHLYVRDRAGSWHELAIADRFVLQSAALIVTPRDTAILAVRWHSWYPANYGRFLRSIVQPEQRAEYGVYRISLDGSDVRYLFPGHALAVSPDRRRVAYLTSANGLSGIHNVWVYDATTSRRTRVVSLVEADPGSGISFDYRWSADGQAVLIRGTAQRVGHERTRGGSVQLVYAIADGRLFDITPER